MLVLYDPGSLRLEAPVMENLAVKMEIGDRVNVHIDALGRDVGARVDEIVPQAEAASRSFLVKVALTEADGLYEGMFGRMQIPSGVRRHLCLPTAAIQKLGQLQFVDVVAPDGMTLERRFITTGRLGSPYQVEVLSGLEAGDRVVLHERSMP
jgi:multidrug efflux pump subunit AcrA (membrane-fusion protein)